MELERSAGHQAWHLVGTAMFTTLFIAGLITVGQVYQVPVVTWLSNRLTGRG